MVSTVRMRDALPQLLASLNKSCFLIFWNLWALTVTLMATVNETSVSPLHARPWFLFFLRAQLNIENGKMWWKEKLRLLHKTKNTKLLLPQYFYPLLHFLHPSSYSCPPLQLPPPPWTPATITFFCLFFSPNFSSLCFHLSQGED